VRIKNLLLTILYLPITLDWNQPTYHTQEQTKSNAYGR